MLNGFLILLGFYLLGHVICAVSGLAIPPAVMGLISLLSYLLLRGQLSVSLVEITSKLLPLLPMFLIPASAGIIDNISVLTAEWAMIGIALTTSLLIGLLVTPLLFKLFLHLFKEP